MYRHFLAITKALGDETRVRALISLESGELCLCQIIDFLQLAPSTVSKHMNILTDAGLVRRRKRGRFHLFRLAGRGSPAPVRQVLEWTRGSLKEDPATRKDLQRIREVRRKNIEELSACYKN